MWIQEDSCGGARFTWPLWMCREAAAELLRTFFVTRFTSFAGWWFQKLLPVILGISWYYDPNWLSSFSRVAQPRTSSREFQNSIKRCPKYAALGAGPLVVRVPNRLSWPLVEGAPRTIKLPNKSHELWGLHLGLYAELLNHLESWSLTGTRWQWWSSW